MSLSDDTVQIGRRWGVPLVLVIAGVTALVASARWMESIDRQMVDHDRRIAALEARFETLTRRTDDRLEAATAVSGEIKVSLADIQGRLNLIQRMLSDRPADKGGR